MTDYQVPSYPHTMTPQEKQDAEREKAERRAAAREQVEHEAGRRELEHYKSEAKRAFVAAGGLSSEFEGQWPQLKRDMLARKALDEADASRSAFRRQVARMFRG